MKEAVSAVEEVLRQQADGKAFNRPRGRVVAGPGVHLNTMGAAASSLGVFGFKSYTVASGRYRFLVYLYSASSRRLLAILEAGRLGQLRTGAASAVATKFMACQHASVAGVLGSGTHARAQLEAICQARAISLAHVYSPNIQHREAYAVEMSRKLGLEIIPAGSAQEAVQGANILVTITNSATPVFDGAWLRPGMHVTAVGGADPYVRELDDLTLQRADLKVVDDLAQARIECGELMMAASSGVVLWEELRELWQVVGGQVPGRRSDDDITLFKSLGMALWDVAAAKAVYEKALAQGAGKELPA